MRKQVVFHLLFFLLFAKAPAQTTEGVNQIEANVGPYTLPDVLQTVNGQMIKTKEGWLRQRRPEILALFKQHMYGKMPSRPHDMHYQVNNVSDTVLGGKAIRKQVTIFFTKGTAGPSMNVLLYLPKAKKKVPVFTGLNFYGNQSITPDPGVAITNRWVMNSKEGGIATNKADEASRGLQQSRWPMQMLIEAGYGLATAYYGDLEPDYTEGWKDGVRGRMADELKTRPDEWGAIGAWAWGLSRMLDYLQTEPTVDAGKVIVTGHSRLGKAALWAGANDGRFAAVVSNDSGEGGAALARRNFGETIKAINVSFPHWFVPAFKQYNDKPEALPVDQHMLLSLIAPRPLYVASAQEDLWADPKGEFLGVLYTAPVYKLFGKAALDVSEMPPVNSPVGRTVRYHIRTGGHDITRYDWQHYRRFADEVVK